MLQACDFQRISIVTSSSSYPADNTFPERKDFCIVLNKISKICQVCFKDLILQISHLIFLINIDRFLFDIISFSCFCRTITEEEYSKGSIKASSAVPLLLETLLSLAPIKQLSTSQTHWWKKPQYSMRETTWPMSRYFSEIPSTHRWQNI